MNSHIKRTGLLPKGEGGPEKFRHNGSNILLIPFKQYCIEVMPLITPPLINFVIPPHIFTFRRVYYI